MSGKLRVTLFITIMMLILAAAAITLILIVNSAAITDNPKGRLINIVSDNLYDSDVLDGRLDIDDIDLFRAGVFTSLYTESGELIVGSFPTSFETDFQNGLVITTKKEEKQYYIYDLYANGYWFRGVIDSADKSSLMGTILTLSYTILPFLIILAACGGWLISYSTFKPIEKLTAAADKISDGNDLTKRLNMRRGTREIKRLAKTFDRMFERLESSFEGQKQFTSDASHELRTPITVILAECSRAKRKAVSKEDFARSINVIEKNANKILQMSEELLSITRLEQGTVKYELEKANLSEFLSSLLEEFQISDEKNIKLTADIEPNVIARYNNILMSRLIQNLLENAYKYGKDGGNITVSLKAEGNMSILSVKDDGIGIAQEDIQKIWQRFFRVTSSNAAQESGTGLGLSIVKQIALLHGGSVSVQSSLNEGSLFSLILPL
ncbi:MAG: ATP-binding protein [Acutalibacteraceae bacterium]